MKESFKLLRAKDLYLKYFGGDKYHTFRAKKCDLEDYFEFLAKFHAYSKLDKLQKSDWCLTAARRYLSEIRKKYSQATLERRYSHLRHFESVINQRIGITEACFLKLSVKQINPKPKKISLKLLNKIKADFLKAKKLKDPHTLRQALVFFLMLEQGLKASEIIKLKCSQVDLKTGYLLNIKNKNSSFRNLKITLNTKKILKIWKKTQKFKYNLLFPPILKTSKSIGSKTIWRLISSIQPKANLTPDQLRAAWINNLLKKLPEQEVLDLAGLQSKQNLKKYL